MYEVLHKLLSDRNCGSPFTVFGLWHLLYLIVIFGGIFLLLFLLKNKNPEVKQRAITLSANCAFGLYVADFFLMPFAYEEIDLEKLPFHACTAMCVMCFLSRHSRFFGKFKVPFAILGLASNLIYVIYPAGVGWYQVHPLCYRVVQTLLFHGLMTAYGLLVLAFDDVRLRWRDCRKELLVIVAMTLWALLGNTLYNGTAGGYSHHFNWFFVTQDPFYLLPESIAPYIMPPVMVVVMFAAVLLVYTGYFTLRKTACGKQAKEAER